MFNPSTARVLVLDDDPVARDLLDALLSLEGYRVTLAASGADALEILAAGEKFEVVLTDLQMPNLGGNALVETLRKAMSPETLLIGMSASEGSEEALRALDGFLPKPFDPPALQAVIEHVLARQSSPEQGLDLAPATTRGTGQSGSDAPLDETIFQALARMIPLSQLGQLYGMTLDDIGKRLARMEASAREGDLPAVRREAHAIKGSCGMVGATELQALAAAVESGTTLNTLAMEQIPAACLRLRRMLDVKLQTV
ncbi:MAG TPA: response regulator [Acidobacteriaceae bacterium]|nr:response regulator [Acidobacteriaceae bacterium]